MGRGMKNTLFAFFIALLMVGCGSPESNAIDEHTLESRRPKGEERYYEQDEEKPFTGWSKEVWRNGQLKSLMQYIDGNPHGLATKWYENGQKEGELTVKDGGVISEKRWDEDGNLLK